MFKERLEKFKDNMTRSDNQNNKKKVENLVVGILIIIITVIAINTILSDSKKSKQGKQTNAVANTISEEESNINGNKLEERLEGILSKISGVGNVEVLINYSESEEIVAMYNENRKETSTQEEDETGGTRVITENDIKRDVIYKEEGGEKTPITQKTVKILWRNDAKNYLNRIIYRM